MNLRRTFQYLLDIIFITSLISIFCILITGGIRIEFLGIGLTSLKRPLLFLITSLLLRKLFYGGISYKEDLIGKFLLFLDGYPLRKIKVFIFIISILCFSMVSSKVIPEQAPTGDEPHYLMIASSLAKDRDLNLRNNYDSEDYYEFYPERLIPHARIYEEDKIYSAHGVGLPVLILPGYILGSRYGASCTIGILFALLSVILFSLCHQATKDKVTSICLTFLMSFTVPLVFYSYQLFTELPAALIIAYLFLYGLTVEKDRTSVFKGIFIAFLLAYLPWLHVRYIVFTVLVSIYLCYKMGLRRILPIAGIVISSIILLLFYMNALYGTSSLTAQYLDIKAGIPYFPKGLLGNFFDSRFGLFLYSPYYIFLGAGLYFFYRYNKSQFLWWALVVIPYILGISSYAEWHGGWCPPVRYMTPVIPLFIIPLGYLFTPTPLQKATAVKPCPVRDQRSYGAGMNAENSLAKRETRKATSVKVWGFTKPTSCKNGLFNNLFFVFVFLSFTTMMIISDRPSLMYNKPEISSRILGYLSHKGITLGWLFPSVFDPSMKDYITVAVWLVFFILLSYGVIHVVRGKQRD